MKLTPCFLLISICLKSWVKVGRWKGIFLIQLDYFTSKKSLLFDNSLALVFLQVATLCLVVKEKWTWKGGNACTLCVRTMETSLTWPGPSLTDGWPRALSTIPSSSGELTTFQVCTDTSEIFWVMTTLPIRIAIITIVFLSVFLQKLFPSSKGTRVWSKGSAGTQLANIWVPSRTTELFVFGARATGAQRPSSRSRSSTWVNHYGNHAYSVANTANNYYFVAE